MRLDGQGLAGGVLKGENRVTITLPPDDAELALRVFRRAELVDVTVPECSRCALTEQRLHTLVAVVTDKEFGDGNDVHTAIDVARRLRAALTTEDDGEPFTITMASAEDYDAVLTFLDDGEGRQQHPMYLEDACVALGRASRSTALPAAPATDECPSCKSLIASIASLRAELREAKQSERRWCDD